MNDACSADFAAVELRTMWARAARLEPRAAQVLGAMCAAPSASIRSQYPTATGAQARYRLLEHQRMSHAVVLEPHVRESVVRSWDLPEPARGDRPGAVGLPRARNPTRPSHRQ